MRPTGSLSTAGKRQKSTKKQASHLSDQTPPRSSMQGTADGLTSPRTRRMSSRQPRHRLPQAALRRPPSAYLWNHTQSLREALEITSNGGLVVCFTPSSPRKTRRSHRRARRISACSGTPQQRQNLRWRARPCTPGAELARGQSHGRWPPTVVTGTPLRSLSERVTRNRLRVCLQAGSSTGTSGARGAPSRHGARGGRGLVWHSTAWPR